MYIRAYLRASTNEQDAERAKESLNEFVLIRGLDIASYYAENESGTKLDRPELNRLLKECKEGDILLVESIDRLTRLKPTDWDRLKTRISNLGVCIVALDLPTTHIALQSPHKPTDTLTEGILKAVNTMLIEMMAVMSHKDYETRRQRQAQGIAKAKAQGKYTGRPIDEKKYNRIISMLNAKIPQREICQALKCSPTTIQKAIKHSKGIDTKQMSLREAR